MPPVRSVPAFGSTSLFPDSALPSLSVVPDEDSSHAIRQSAKSARRRSSASQQPADDSLALNCTASILHSSLIVCVLHCVAVLVEVIV